MSYREGQFHIKQTPHPTPWQSFVYSFGHYSISSVEKKHLESVSVSIFQWLQKVFCNH